MYPSPRPPCKKGGGGVRATKNSFARKCGEERESRERERDGEIERGKEAVNEDAKARSARAQK